MTVHIQTLPGPRIVCIPVTADEIDFLSVTCPSVLQNTATKTEIVLLAVGFDPALLPPLLPAPASARIKIACATGSSDPWQAVLRELPPNYAEHDLLLLRPGIEVPWEWDTRLALAAYRQPGIAVTVPMCNSSSFLALLESGAIERLDLERIDRLLLAHSPRRDPEIPILFSGCAYLRRAALRALESRLISQSAASLHLPPLEKGGRGGFRQYYQWLPAAFREQGWSVVSCDHIYVQDHAPECRQQEMADIENLEEVRLIGRAHPLTGLRVAIRELLKQAVTSAPKIRPPVQLHITHSWGGGLDYWVGQYCGTDKVRDNLVLRSIGTWGAFGQRIALYRSAVMDQPLRYWDLDYPIRATALAHLQYRAILREVIADFGVEALLISSLIGHALDALTTGLPTVIVAHDYYPFCPAIVIRFNEVCSHCELERLERCFVENEQNRFFRNVSATEWLSLRRRFAQLAVTETVRFAVPSPAVARHWQTLVSELRDSSFTVIPHGLDFAPARLPAPVAGERLRVVILGSLAPQKGLVLLEQLWPLIADRIDLYLVGCDGGGETVQGQPGMTVIPRYHHAELPDLLASIQPEVGLLLSIWPETFSYTLSELWLFGIPVVVTDLGSFGDRIQPGVNGFVCPPRADAVAERLLAIAADRACLTPIREWLADFRHRSVAEMVADYHALLPLPVISAARYFPGSTARSDQPAMEDVPRALHIDVRAPFGQVLQEFGQYVGQKLVTTPRLRSWQKRGLAALLRLGLRGATVVTRIRSRS